MYLKNNNDYWKSHMLGIYLIFNGHKKTLESLKGQVEESNLCI